MSKNLITVDFETPLGEALEIMTERNIRRLLVTDEGGVIGIVTQKDLVRGTLKVSDSFRSSFNPDYSP